MTTTALLTADHHSSHYHHSHHYSHHSGGVGGIGSGGFAPPPVPAIMESATQVIPAQQNHTTPATSTTTTIVLGYSPTPPTSTSTSMGTSTGIENGNTGDSAMRDYLSVDAGLRMNAKPTRIVPSPTSDYSVVSTSSSLSTASSNAAAAAAASYAYGNFPTMMQQQQNMHNSYSLVGNNNCNLNNTAPQYYHPTPTQDLQTQQVPLPISAPITSISTPSISMPVVLTEQPVQEAGPTAVSGSSTPSLLLDAHKGVLHPTQWHGHGQGYAHFQQQDMPMPMGMAINMDTNANWQWQSTGSTAGMSLESMQQQQHQYQQHQQQMESMRQNQHLHHHSSQPSLSMNNIPQTNINSENRRTELLLGRGVNEIPFGVNILSGTASAPMQTPTSTSYSANQIQIDRPLPHLALGHETFSVDTGSNGTAAAATYQQQQQLYQQQQQPEIHSDGNNNSIYFPATAPVTVLAVPFQSAPPPLSLFQSHEMHMQLEQQQQHQQLHHHHQQQHLHTHSTLSEHHQQQQQIQQPMQFPSSTTAAPPSASAAVTASLTAFVEGGNRRSFSILRKDVPWFDRTPSLKPPTLNTALASSLPLNTSISLSASVSATTSTSTSGSTTMGIATPITPSPVVALSTGLTHPGKDISPGAISSSSPSLLPSTPQLMLEAHPLGLGSIVDVKVEGTSVNLSDVGGMNVATKNNGSSDEGQHLHRVKSLSMNNDEVLASIRRNQAKKAQHSRTVSSSSSSSSASSFVPSERLTPPPSAISSTTASRPMSRSARLHHSHSVSPITGTKRRRNEVDGADDVASQRPFVQRRRTEPQNLPRVSHPYPSPLHQHPSLYTHQDDPFTAFASSSVTSPTSLSRRRTSGKETRDNGNDFSSDQAAGTSSSSAPRAPDAESEMMATRMGIGRSGDGGRLVGVEMGDSGANGSKGPRRNRSDQSMENDEEPAYAFIALPGNAVRKRPRRKFEEITRNYACIFPGCTKAYGTLNHLNAHVTMQDHGPKRTPIEFKELRRIWKLQQEEEMNNEFGSATFPDGGDGYVMNTSTKAPDNGQQGSNGSTSSGTVSPDEMSDGTFLPPTRKRRNLYLGRGSDLE